AMADIPRIISLDDHVIEPPHLWQRWLPREWRDRGPRVVRDGSTIDWVQGVQTFRKGGDGPETDWWVYEDLAWSHQMLNECAGDSDGRLIPLCIVPLWDARLAADEVRRNAARGVRAVAFSELPGKLGLPTIHARDGYWEPFFAACNDTRTAIFMHIGSGSH